MGSRIGRWFGHLRLNTTLAGALAVLVLGAHFGAAATQTVNGITINEDLPQARRGTVYSHQVPISGGIAPYVVSRIGANTLPASIDVGSTGLVSGVVSCAQGNGSNRQDIRITDSSTPPVVADFTGNRGLAINVTAGPANTCVALTISPTTLPNPTAGTSYSQTVTASGGLAPYAYTITAGALPAGLTLDSATGTISGTPTTAGAFSFTLQAKDAADSVGTQAFTGTVSPPITVSPASLPNGAVNSAYSQTFSAAGGTAPYTFAVTAGALPAGLTLSGATLSGTPSAQGTFNFTVTATATGGASGARSYAVTIAPAIAISPVTLANAVVGTPYSQVVTATGGNGALTLSLTGSLPTGLSFNSATGAISGTPTTAQTSSFSIVATDSAGATATRGYTVVVHPAIAVNPGAAPDTTVGVAYSQAFSASGGSGGYTFSHTGTLPTGLTLNGAAGVLSGTPSAAGSFGFTIVATDTLGAQGSRAYAVTVAAALAIAPASLPATTAGVAYDQLVTASGGTGAKSFAVTAGALPAGVTLGGASGALSGTATTAGTYNFTITATDAVGATAARAYTIVVNAALAIAPASLPATTVGVAYNQALTASGGTGAIAFSLSAGALPPGLTLSNGGALGGTPTAAGAYAFTVLATDTLGATATRSYTLTVNAAVQVNPATLPDATTGSAYSQTIVASGGTPGVTLSIAGALPAGLTFTPATGAISGTPTAAGTSNFTIHATDSVGATGSRAYALVVNPAAAIAVAPATAPNTTVGVAYSQAFSASGGSGGYTFSHTGTLPTGLTLNGATGVLSGTPSAAGSFSFTIVATDGTAATGSRAYSVTVAPAIVVSPASLPAWTTGVAYNQTVAASGGTGTVTLALAGSLPPGLAFNAATGALTGTPTAPGTYAFAITGSDTVGASGVRNYSVTIHPALALAPATLPDGTVGSAYAQTVSASGGAGGTTFAVTAGSLPAGLTLNPSTGQIGGTPSAGGPANFTITATDSVGATASRAYAVTINAGIAVNPVSLPASTAGVPYAQTISATGGNGSYTFAVTAGTLPAGLSLNTATGAITGTPSASGASTFTVTVTDGLGATGSRGYTVTINPAIAVGPASLPTATAGGAYAQAITASGGTGTLIYAITAGALPAGLTLNTATGQLSGTPSASGTFNFTVSATDSVGAIGARAYTLAVNAGVAVNPATLANGTVGAAYAQAVVAVGGNGGYTYAVTAGALPAGLTLNAATGQLGGTPTTAGASNFTITATDNLGATGARAYAVTVHPALALMPATLPDGVVGAAYSQTVTTTGGSGTVTFAVTAGALPAGLTLNAGNGAIGGTPTVAAATTFTITATDSLGATASRAYTLTTLAGVAVNPASLPPAMLGAVYAQSLSATGGSGSYTYAVTAGALPPGLTLNAATGALGGTPMTAGTSSFTITATSGAVTGARSYAVTVASALAVGPASLAAANVGAPYNQTLVPAGGTAPYAFAISAGALPAGLSLDPATGAITGTPTAAATANFSITLTDGAGFSTTRSYALTVAPPTLALSAGFGAGRVGSAYDQPLQVSGGTAPYVFSVSSGRLPPGLAIEPASGALRGTPTASGRFVFVVAVVDATGASAAFEQTVTIEPRPDPTLEASVRGVNAAQIAAASRFGRAQLDNVGARLSSLHGGRDPCGFAIDIGTNARWERSERQGEAERGATRAAAPQAAGAGEPTRTGCDRPFAVWAGGNVDFGFLRPHGAAHRNDFTTSGLTLGVDARAWPELVVGAAIGYGRDRTDVDPAGSHSTGQAQSGSLYGAYRIAPSLFVDAQLGHGRLDFDAQRWSAPAAVRLNGERTGAQSFGSLGVSGVVRIVGITLAPYGRIDRVRSTLDGYAETGTADVALRYAELTINEDSILAGLRGSVDIALQSMVVTPSLRVEQRRTRSRGAEQSVAYADDPSVMYALMHAGETRGFTTAGIGVLLRLGAVLTVDLEYSYTAGAGETRTETARAVLRGAF